MSQSDESTGSGEDVLIVGMGGTTRDGSSSETALQAALTVAEEAGAEVRRFGASELALPLYDPSAGDRTPQARALVDAVQHADGIVVASPGYHGTVSGLVKNALDYVEDLREDQRPYFEGRPVGCIAVAYGWQAAVNTLRTLRDVTHALRGWPTPYGAAINAANGVFADGTIRDDAVIENLRMVGDQVVQFTRLAQRASA